MSYTYYYLAQAYGRGVYNSATYSCTTEQQQAGQCTAAATTTSGSSGNSGTLANTGIAALTFVSIAALVIFIALLIRVFRRKPAKYASGTRSTEAVTASSAPQTKL